MLDFTIALAFSLNEKMLLSMKRIVNAMATESVPLKTRACGHDTLDRVRLAQRPYRLYFTQCIPTMLVSSSPIEEIWFLTLKHTCCITIFVSSNDTF